MFNGTSGDSLIMKINSEWLKYLADSVLTPLSYIYKGIVVSRNWMFDHGILPQEEMDVPVVVVGNINVGGTGKTPHTEYIVEALSHDYRVGVLSRGYKRHTSGFILATNKLTPNDLGDEAYQIYRKFGSRITLAVCESRRKGIKEMLRIDPKIDVMVLDDAFQHRYVKPKVSVVLMEYARPVYEDNMLPLGTLREPAKGLLRADMVVVTKCPREIRPIDLNLIKKKLELFPSQELFFSSIQYYNLMPVFPEMVGTMPTLQQMDSCDALLIVTGIANHIPFVRFLKAFRTAIKVIHFGDHHNFTRDDFELIGKRYEAMSGNRKVIVTTEKDAVRMANNPYFPHELKKHVFYVPIKVTFDQPIVGQDFIGALKKKIQE